MPHSLYKQSLETNFHEGNPYKKRVKNVTTSLHATGIGVRLIKKRIAPSIPAAASSIVCVRQSESADVIKIFMWVSTEQQCEYGVYNLTSLQLE